VIDGPMERVSPHQQEVKKIQQGNPPLYIRRIHIKWIDIPRVNGCEEWPGSNATQTMSHSMTIYRRILTTLWDIGESRRISSATCLRLHKILSTFGDLEAIQFVLRMAGQPTEERRGELDEYDLVRLTHRAATSQDHPHNRVRVITNEETGF